MKILEFIFKLLFQFISFEQGRFIELKEKAFAWQNSLKDTPEHEQKWFHKLFRYDDQWWFQLGLAIFFLVAFKAVRAWLLTDPLSPNEDDDDDDDDGDDDVVSAKRAKISLTSFKL